jgi:hypothetical protein
MRGLSRHASIGLARTPKRSAASSFTRSAAADFSVGLITSVAARPELKLRLLLEILNDMPEETRTATQPFKLSALVRHNSEMEMVAVIPDIAFAIYNSGKRFPYLVEIDLGSMPVERASHVDLAQAARAQRCAQSETARQAICMEEFSRAHHHQHAAARRTHPCDCLVDARTQKRSSSSPISHLLTRAIPSPTRA